MVEEYDSFLEYSRIVCAFLKKTDAQQYKQVCDEEVHKAEKQLKKCYKCPLRGEGSGDQSFAESYKCGVKRLRRYDDGSFYCDLVSDMQYDSYSLYSVKEVELR